VEVAVVLGLHQLQVAPRLGGDGGGVPVEAAGGCEDIPLLDRGESLGVEADQIEVAGGRELEGEARLTLRRHRRPAPSRRLVVLDVVAVVGDGRGMGRGGEAKLSRRFVVSTPDSVGRA
jgi:hypothetical protein